MHVSPRLAWRALAPLALCASLALSLTACDSGSDDEVPTGISPGDASAVSAALTVPGATRRSGAPPAPSTAPDAPTASGAAPSVTVGPGGRVTLVFAAESAEALAGIYFAVAGADDYFDIEGVTDGSSVTFTFVLPSGIGAGGFGAGYCVYNASGQVSNVLTTTIQVSPDGPSQAQGGTGNDDTGATDGGPIGWSVTAVPVRGTAGRRFLYTCPPNGTFSVVWGTDLYTDDSSICTAAVHVGRITREAGGSVTIETRPGAESYTGSTRNGVTTNDWPSWGNSFVVL